MKYHHKRAQPFSKSEARLFFDGTQVLNIYRLHHLLTVGDRRFLESLTAAKFFHDAGFLKFAFKFFKSSFDELAFFYLYDYHIMLLDFVVACSLAGQNYKKHFTHTNLCEIFRQFFRLFFSGKGRNWHHSSYSRCAGQSTSRAWPGWCGNQTSRQPCICWRCRGAMATAGRSL